MNKENFTHKCNRCKHNFATCKSKHPLFLSDLPNEINEAFPELESDTVLWCDSYEQASLREQPLIIRQISPEQWITVRKNGGSSPAEWIQHISNEEALQLIQEKHLRLYNTESQVYILPSKE